MYKRLLIGIVAAICLSLSTFAIADEIGVGPAYVDGHSDNGQYGMNNEGTQSFGGVLHYEKDKDWAKILGNNKIGIDPGISYMYFRWTKNHADSDTSRRYAFSETIDSHILGVYFKPYWEIHKKVRLFALAGPGLEFADDGTNFAVTVGAGLQMHWTDHVSTSLTQYEVFSDPTKEYRRFDAVVLSLDFRW